MLIVSTVLRALVGMRTRHDGAESLLRRQVDANVEPRKVGGSAI